MAGMSDETAFAYLVRKALRRKPLIIMLDSPEEGGAYKDSLDADGGLEDGSNGRKRK